MRKWIAFALVVICVALVATVRFEPKFSPLKPDPGIPTFEQTFGDKPGPADYEPASEKPRADCAYPGYPEGAQVVLLSAERGLAISSASLGGQDVSTTAILVVVEPGDTPLYVIATSSTAVLGRFSGATERTRRLVLAGHLRARIGRMLELRAAPEITFKNDESVARAARIETLLAQIKDGRTDAADDE
jgi:hypothetical protein